MPDPVPLETPPPTPGSNPDPQRGKTITCECCGSKLDRHGNLLRRGDLAKQMIDSEDSIRELKKQIAKAAEDLAAANRTIDELKATQPAKKSSVWNREV